MFPQKPKLLWLLQNVSTSTIKERVDGKKMTAQDAEAAYLRNVLTALQSGDNPKNALLTEQLQSAFPDQSCYTLPEEGTDVFTKRMDKLVRTVLESDRNKYAKGAVLNGPFFESILVSMLAHRDNVFQVRLVSRPNQRAHCKTLRFFIVNDRLFVVASGRIQSTTAA